MRTLCQETNTLDEPLERAFDEVFTACEVCAGNGRPASSKKVSLTHVNAACNEDLQTVLFHITFRDQKHTVINITEISTRFTELCITSDGKMDTTLRTIETSWICQHGAPHAISADDEYNRAPLRNYFESYSNQFKSRPARRHHKIAVVERENGTLKVILQKLNDEKSDAAAHPIVSSAAFLFNLFSGNRLLSSFQLVRGYSPSVVGIPKSSPTVVP